MDSHGRSSDGTRWILPQCGHSAICVDGLTQIVTNGSRQMHWTAMSPGEADPP